jgi:pimeloyl-ACP methyl ester carboxylesterase
MDVKNIIPELYSTEDYHSFTKYIFKLDGVECYLVEPKEEKGHLRWIWRSRFFGVAPEAELQLLNDGYFLAYCDVATLFGGSEAMARWDKFYNFMIGAGFAKRPAFIGCSRGGLPVYNWASKNPDKVSCIYADNPVCTGESWPLGRGTGPGGTDKDKKDIMESYGMESVDAEVPQEFIPLKNLAPLVKNNIPLIHVCGDADEVVPFEENTVVLKKLYEELGGKTELIIKPGGLHHPHGLEDPQPIVSFIKENYIDG